MVHEILSFQVGQCGNSIGLQFWQNVSKEHGLDPGGWLATDGLLQSIDDKSVLFEQNECGKYMARCIMLDLEPRVIQSIKNSDYSKLFDHRNMFVGIDGGGAGNNWANGYIMAHKYEDILLELIQRETEAMDLMEGSLISHGISGGTGSGMGSRILELLTDCFPKKIVQTYSVFPTSVNIQAESNEKGVKKGQYGDIVIEPYNSLLTLSRLISYADSVVVLDNLALHNMTPTFFSPHPSFASINKIVSDVMTTSLASIRYPSTMFNCLSDVVFSLTPIRTLHFLMTGYTPLNSPNSQETVKPITKTSVESVMKHLVKMRNMMVCLQHPTLTPHGYISVFNIIQGSKASESVQLMRQTIPEFRERMHYLPWAVPVYQTIFCPRSQYQVHTNHISGLTLTNHSSIVNIFHSCLSQFGKLYHRMAYIDQMKSTSGFDDLTQELEECKLSCENLILEYKAALGSEYPRKPFSIKKCI